MWEKNCEQKSLSRLTNRKKIIKNKTMYQIEKKRKGYHFHKTYGWPFIAHGSGGISGRCPRASVAERVCFVDFARDTSDTEAHSASDGEFEPVTEPEDEAPLDDETSAESDVS